MQFNSLYIWLNITNRIIRNRLFIRINMQTVYSPQCARFVCSHAAAQRLTSIAKPIHQIGKITTEHLFVHISTLPNKFSTPMAIECNRIIKYTHKISPLCRYISMPLFSGGTQHKKKVCSKWKTIITHLKSLY